MNFGASWAAEPTNFGGGWRFADAPARSWAGHLGDRSLQNASDLRAALPKGDRGRATRSDYWDAYAAAFPKRTHRCERTYSPAYLMPSGGKGAPCARKHRMHLELLARMLRDELPERIADMGTMAQAFAALRSYPTIGDFLAYQYVTDLNYSMLTNFSETEFVVPGPGALSGLRKCFADTGRLTAPRSSGGYRNDSKNASLL